MQRTPSSTKIGNTDSTPAATLPQPDPQIAELLDRMADAPSVSDGLQLMLDLVSVLGAEAEGVSLSKAGHVTALKNPGATAGVRRNIEGHFKQISLTLTCIGSVSPEQQQRLVSLTDKAALIAERWVRKLWTPESEEERSDSGMIGTSIRMRELAEEIRLASRSRHNVLINGESGSGKTTAATSIHRQSVRSARPFVEVNCANFQESLLESELFGFEKGAFTGAAAQKKGLFEEASGGTLFLDEIAEMKPELQAKFLKAIEQKKIRRLGGTRDISCDVRIIAATSRDLPEMIKAGTFREDLYYRLAVLEIKAAPLRERREDVPALILRCLEEEQKEAGRATGFQIEEAAVGELVAYDWPGNVRQLQNVVARLASRVEEGSVVTLEDVRRTLTRQLDSPADRAAATAAAAEPAVAKGADGSLVLPAEVRMLLPGESLRSFVDRVTKAAIDTTRELEGSINAAAKRLDLPRTSLLTKRKRLKNRLARNQETPVSGATVAA